MTNIEKIKAEMLSISKKTKLPEFYVEDLSKDLSLVETFSGHKLVWVLRTCGSALVPTKVGVHPTHVTHWIWGNSGQQIMTYSVDTLSGVIEKIDFEEAERMIMQPPRQLTLSLGKEAISKQVNQVLAIGCDLKVWGVFESPSHVDSIGGWAQWQQYFLASGNHLMADFVGKAIRFTSQRL